MITVRCSSGDVAEAETPAAAELAARTLIMDACVATGGLRDQYVARYTTGGYNFRVRMTSTAAVRLLREQNWL